MDITDKRFLVIGLGESGLAMAKWLIRQGALVRVADSRENPPNRAALAAFAPEVPVIAGPFQAEIFDNVEAIALSPGVPLATPEIAAVAKKIPVLSEVDLFVDALEKYVPWAQMVAVTGSNGKTTTTALVAHLLNGPESTFSDYAVACGNISPSLLDALMAALDAYGQGKIGIPSIWVLELSSFQLETTHALPARAAVVLNVSEDHLDRYPGGMAAYAEAKARIFQGRPDPIRVVNRDCDWSLAMGGCGDHMVTFGLDAPPRAGHYGLAKNALWQGKERLIGLDELPLQGLHNAANIMAALALCQAMGADPKALLPALKTFRGLPHRVETVAEIGGVLYVDDSKGTNVGATLAAIAGMGKPVAVVLGGDGKGQNFVPLQAALKKHGRAVALIGKDQDAIAQAIDGCGLPTESFADLPRAVNWLAAQARPGDCVLLSPACASWDMFHDYAQRAKVFVAAVRKLQRGTKA
ncbi:MAG: UDP-N-acetylmuramoyl-L-alanine--D-glutamate ligase [Zoogloeaceae bacterium]|jgi:UDP-N-acetylmuramoylalanine--D-glutamate ligase|nr:UDP-N-acetylmuramoyl-L-alanine--D-glutamate ligase [Zoogloeaceae bacterium]